MKAKLNKTIDGFYVLNDEFGNLIATDGNATSKKLSMENCQAIERGYDLDDLADEYIIVKPKYREHEHNMRADAFKAGFQKALEILGDKKFSEEDVISMIEKSRETGLTAQFLILTKQQTEWDVEVETEEISHYKGSRLIDEYRVNKLDADGCLILKRLI